MKDKHHEALQDIMRRYPEAADEIANVPINDDGDINLVERFAAAWEVRKERARELRELVGGGEAGRVAREREEHRARYEYGLNYDPYTYTPPDES